MRGKASEQTFSLDIEPPPVSKSFFLWLLTFVVGLFGLFAAGSHLFAGGFLLNRLELDSVSPCDMPLPTGDLTTDPLSTYKGNSTACWHPPRFKRSLLIIIDALRFDFMEHRPDILNDDAPHYINKMPLFNQIISSNNSTSQRGHGLLCRARADPPTTTLQRIKALMTGNLPTVVDAGSNFASSKVSEDSLLSQWTSNGVTAAMVGDDTWVRLFPSSFTHSAVPFESFDVWDLHTVDNGVIDHLFPLLDRNRNATLQKWGFAVGHFLGVDHVGHRFGPSHPEMGLKLSQMNGVLQRVFDAVDEETVVYVMGDHGMDAKGDHGGDSEDELNSGLFVYSKTPLLEKDETWDRIMARLESLNFGTDEPLVTQFNARTFPQIDLVPTAALLTGIPIPFGNLGTIIPELFYTSSTSTTLSPLQNLVRVSRLNAHQIHRYMAEYTSKRAWASDALKDLESLYQEAERLYLTFRDSTHSTDATTQRDIDTYIAYTLYTKKVLVQARRIWSRFDVSLIIMGIVVLTLTVLCLIATISQGPGLLYTHGPISLGTGLVSSLGSVVLRPVQTVLSVSEDSVMMAHHEALFMFLVGGLGMLLIRAVISGFSSLASFDVTSVRKVWSNNVCLGLLLSLMYIAAPGSDSFTIWEDHLTVYLLQTFGVYNLIMAVSVKESEARWEIVRNSLLFIGMTRLSLYSTICRPDQQPYCSPTFNSSPTSSVAGLPGLTLLLLTSILVIWMSKHLLKGSDNMHGTGGILVGILLPTGVVVSMTYWVLDTAHGHSYILPGGLQTLQLWIPRIGFTTLVMGLVFVWVSDSLSMTVEVSSESGPTQIIPQSPKTLLVRGLANAIGSSYFSFSASLTICLGLVQKPMGCAMLYLCFSQVCVLVELMHLWRDKVSVGDLTMGVFEELDEVPQSPRTRSISARQKTALPPTRTTTVESGLLFLYTVILFLLGVRYFYATGHQRALSTIQYEVGFIGLEKVNWVLSPLMILVNTYGGPILTSFCLPLLVTWKRPLLKIHDSRFKTELSLLVATYLSLILSGLTSATLFAGHFRRHMTGWRVFAPKYLFSLGETGLEIVVIVVGIVWVWIAVGQYQEFLRRLVLHTRPKSKSV